MGEHLARIELEIQSSPDQGELVSIRTFTHTTDSLTGLLNQIAADHSDPVNVEWFVSDLRTGSVILAIDGKSAERGQEEAPREIMRATIEALAAFDSGRDIRFSLSYAAVKKIQELADRRQDADGSIVVRGFGHAVPITTSISVRAEALLTRRLTSFGSVEGRIETISIHGDRPEFILADARDGHAIICRCDEDTLFSATKALGGRVRVAGTIKRRFDGSPDSVDVAEVRILRNRDQLPQVSDIRGILADPSETLPVIGMRGEHV